MTAGPEPTPSGDARTAQLERLRRLDGRRARPAHEPAASRRVVGDPGRTPPPAAQPVKRTKRHHPAGGARAGALAISCVATAGLVIVFARLDAAQSAGNALDALPAPITVGSPTISEPGPTTAGSTPITTSPNVAAAPPATSVPTTAAVEAVNGDVVNTQFGPVQVQLQFSNGGIAEVAVISYPDSDGKSQRINARALPQLRNEVLAAQSAQIDTVSGATYTSIAYIRSLQSALDAANVAGVTALT